jgi:hypothetical protein
MAATRRRATAKRSAAAQISSSASSGLSVFAEPHCVARRNGAFDEYDVALGSRAWCRRPQGGMPLYSHTNRFLTFSECLMAYKLSEYHTGSRVSRTVLISRHLKLTLTILLLTTRCWRKSSSLAIGWAKFPVRRYFGSVKHQPGAVSSMASAFFATSLQFHAKMGTRQLSHLQ